MILITTYYIPVNEERYQEIIKCLQENINNEYIKSIVLLNDNIYDLKDIINDPNNKIKQIIVNSDPNYRLKYSDAVKYINDNLIGEVCILANSDIYFNQTLKKINRYNLSGKMFALLRYEYENDLDNLPKIYSNQWNEPRCDAQDTWIFISPLKIDLNKIDFSFGIPGCDNMFASIVQRFTPLLVTNPCYTIQSIHVHNSKFRTYSEKNRLHGKYLLVYPSDINTNSKLEFKDF